MQLTIGQFVEMRKLNNTFKSSVGKLQDELDQHLDSINQNSLDIQGNYDYLEELNEKIDKLNEKVDKLTEIFNTNVSSEKIENKTELTEKEKEVFLVLYTSNEPLSHEEVASRSALPIYLVEDLIDALVIKKIPIQKKTFAGKTLLILEEDFKKVQSQTGIIDVRTNN